MTRTAIMILALACSAVVIVVTACGEAENTIASCDPGEIISCPCGGDLPDGSQTCEDDGTFGPCDCGASDSDTDTDTDTDDDTDTNPGPCDELADAAQAAIDEVCEIFPDCSICDPPDTDTGPGEMNDEECQEVLDSWDHDAIVNAFTMMCEMEAGNDPCPDYTGTDECCLNSNPCDWELNDICDCDSTCAWDAVDCEW